MVWDDAGEARLSVTGVESYLAGGAYKALREGNVQVSFKSGERVRRFQPCFSRDPQETVIGGQAGGSGEWYEPGR